MKDKRAIIYCWSESDRIPFEHCDGDFIICADSGIDYARRVGVRPNIVLGDFDSSDRPAKSDGSFDIISLPREKDDTDALYAARTALAEGFGKIYLAGGLGGRLDHTLGAISVLRFLEKEGAECIICDGKTKISFVRAGTVKRFMYDENVEYISVFPSNENASGVTIKGLKYSLDNFELTSEFPIGVSNEYVSKQDGYIGSEKGDLLIIEIFR
ncbi:MAG: thiamine diphosphokinase [Ruminococcaceae bacterium]|nr:thiamine diphosphokinase [Oscillospiraceae bacterium]